MSSEESEKIKNLFDEYDKNHNGKLEKSEFVIALRDLVTSLSDGKTPVEIDKMVDEAIDIFDLNRNGIIEMNEFTNLIKFFIEEKGLSI